MIMSGKDNNYANIVTYLKGRDIDTISSEEWNQIYKKFGYNLRYDESGNVLKIIIDKK